MDPEIKLSPISFLICLHIQSTCDQKVQMKPCQQAIQIDACVLEIKNAQAKLINRFHKLIKPQCNPKLTEFCTKITGITTFQLKQKEKFQVVIQQFQKWILSTPNLNQNNFAFVTWGNWTLKSGLIRQINTKKIKKLEIFHTYTDLKRIFNRQVGQAKNVFQAANMLKIDTKNDDNLTKGQNKNEIMAQILKQLVNTKKFMPDRKLFTILQDLPKVNITDDLEYLLVLDFEATCQQNIKLQPCSQIIEFPVMVIDLNSGKIISQFHYYITPTFHPQLTKFCTQLTGITQQMVNKRPKLEQVLVQLDKWIQNQKYLHSKNFTFVTCGDWDLATCLKNEAKVKKIQIADYLKSYINIKKVFMSNMPQYDRSMGMMGMLKALNIPHQGRHHSGIDDVKNICNVCIGLMDKKGYKFTRKAVIELK